MSQLDERVAGVEQKVTDMDGRLASIDQNVLVLMRHLGI
jgi:hypothetical protein